MNDQHKPRLPLDKALLTAALLIPQLSLAESAPERATLSYKYLDYLDSQPEADRIQVKAHALSAILPINEAWSFSGTLVADTVSGASPDYHTQGLTSMHDERNMVEAAITRYFENASLAVSASQSRESDYISKSLSITGAYQSEDRNTTLTAGAGFTHDNIDAPSLDVVGETKNIQDVLFGVTQVFTRNDIGQLMLRHATGSGYYTDPYKAFDKRPTTRNNSTVLLRWNHHIENFDSTLRFSYRYYTDTFAINAHTLGLEYAHPMPHDWTLTPILRLHSQSAASFYVEVDPELQAAGQFTYPAETAVHYSEDQRLSAFGAITLGLKVKKQLSPDLSMDVKYESYKQRSRWSLNDDASVGLAPFNARSLQIGMTYQF